MKNVTKVAKYPASHISHRREAPHLASYSHLATFLLQSLQQLNCFPLGMIA